MAKPYRVLSVELPDTIVGFCVKLNSFCLRVHLYWDSYIVVVLSKEQVKLVLVIKSLIKTSSLSP